MKRGLLLLLPFLYLTSCSKYESKSAPAPLPIGTEVSGEQTHPTQIGSFFDRAPEAVDSQKILASSIFKLESGVSGREGIATYLGLFNDLHLFVTNKHVLESGLDNCDFMVSITSVDEESFFICAGEIMTIAYMDITFFTAERISGSEPLRPLKLSSKNILDKGNFTLRTIDRDSNLIVSDNGDDCFALDSEARLIFDPEEGSTLVSPSWSTPIGCDAIPGDSGAPVMDSFGGVVGILWGGKMQKSYKDSVELKIEAQTRNPKIWTDYNFMVPSHIILQEVRKAIVGGETSVSKVLSVFLEKTYGEEK